MCSSAAVHPEASDLAVGVSGGRVLIYDTSEWKEKTSFSTGEGTVPCKICYLAERKGKETTWFLLVSCTSEKDSMSQGAAVFSALFAINVHEIG